MQYQGIELLDWDSNFFNKKIGRVFFEETMDILSVLEYAKIEKYDLVYVIGKHDLYFSSNILSKFGGQLVDRKVQYTKEITSFTNTSNVISEYDSLKLDVALEQLTYESGEYSRFRLDKRFDKCDFYRLYKVWITKSVEKEIADKVFVAKESENICGMITLKIGPEKGSIGLIAVSKQKQGCKYGRRLVDACCSELLNAKVKAIEVSTQFANKNACSFYERCGFYVKTTTNIYHFWL